MDIRDRALVSILYITGCRINEVLKRFRPKDIKKEVVKEKTYYIFKVYTEKKRHFKNFYRTIPINEKTEGDFIGNILDYIHIANIGDSEPLFNMTRQHGWNIVKRWLGFNPHHLRHIRNTHLAEYYGFTDQMLVRWNGWQDSRPASVYSHLSPSVFYDKI